MIYEEDGTHNCHFCGTYVKNGYETIHEKVEIRDYSGDRGVLSARPRGQLGWRWITYKKRHWLSDCRPDLVYHEPGPACTWYNMDYQKKRNEIFGDWKPDCYAYKDNWSGDWGEEHIHFYLNGPM